MVATRHLDATAAMVAEWCGLIEIQAGPRGGISFVSHRRAFLNPNLDPFVLAHLLWRQEAQQLLLSYGASNAEVNAPRKQLYEMLAKQLSVRELAVAIDVRPGFPPAFGRIRRLVSDLMRPWFPVSISMQIPAA